MALDKFKRELRAKERERKAQQAQQPQISITTKSIKDKPSMVKVTVTIVKTVEKRAVNEFLAEYNLER